MVLPAARPRMSPKQRRSGYTFIELVISMGSSVILMAGLSSVLFISTKAITPDATASNENSRSSLAAAQLAADLRLALSFSERTARAATFQVPDRDADGQLETLRYWWTGVAGDPLMYQCNGGAAVALASNVQQFNLTALTRVIPAAALTPIPNRITYQSSARAKAPSVATVNVAKPSGVVAGDLLIAAVAVNGVTGLSISPAASGWTAISQLASPATGVGLGVWWKIAGSSEAASYSFNWSGNHNAMGWIMRYTGANGTTPIHAVAPSTGTSSSPSCAAATTSMNNTLVVRIGGFARGAFTTTDNTGMSNHTSRVMDRTGTGGADVSGGAADDALPVAGTTGTANFTLTSAQEFAAVTIAIAP